MKLPSLWLVGCFAAGILFSRALAAPYSIPPGILLTAAAALLLLGAIPLQRSFLISSAALGLAAWVCLGAASARLEQLSVPVNLASALIDSGKLDSSVALRWRGRLRSDPLALPWGTRYEVILQEVESAGEITPVSGGLRATLYKNDANLGSPPRARAGDRVEILARALPVRNFGNPGSFDFRGYLEFQGIHLQATLRNPQLLTVLEASRPTAAERLARLRGRLLLSLDGLLSSRADQAALARAMLLGDRSFVEHDRAAEFQQTGVYHVLVLAGLHVAALTAFFIWAGRRLRFSLLSRTLVTLVALTAYVGIVEDRPSILRAALMAGIYLCAQLVYRRMDLLNVAALSALVLLAARPSEIGDVSFILSYSAVGIIGALAAPWLAQTSEPYRHGLEYLDDVTRDASHAPRVIQFRIELRAAVAWLAARLPAKLAHFGGHLVRDPLRVGLYLWELAVISLVLQLALLAPMAHYFHRVTLAGPLANIPAVLLTGVIVPLGFFTLATSLAWRGFAIPFAKLLALLLSALESSVQWFARWRLASYRIPGPPFIVIVAFALCAVLLAAAIRARRQRWQWLGAGALLVTAGLIASYPFAPQLSAKNLEVTVLDVGQGDSLYVSFPGGRTMLIDGGGELGNFHQGGMRSGIDVGEEVVSPYLWSRGLKRIDVVTLTHAHEDHLGGIPAVLENFHVGELWVGRDVESAAYQNILALAAARGVRIVHVKDGSTFARGEVSGTILWPENTSEERVAKNDDSVVIRLTDGSRSLLLPGDIERVSERQILADDPPVTADFLKVAHHGSRTSTTDAFLAAVRPNFAAISAGRDNSFGHPSPEIVEKLKSAGVRVYRTDRDGAITVTTDGQALTVTTFLHAAR